MIIITGGAGFIGSNMVASMDSDGRDIVVCDRLGTSEKWRNIAKRRVYNFVFPEQLPDYLRQIGHADAVIHMGAISSTTVTDGDQVIRDNYMFSRQLWQWCAQSKTPFIYASSAATYGDGTNGFVDNSKQDELAKLKPLNLYGWSKHAFDRFVVNEADKGRPTPPQWVGLKFFNVYGPNEYHKGGMQSVISQLFPKIIKHEPAKLFRSHSAEHRDGQQMRDFVYVMDCIRLMKWLLENPKISGIFNCGTGKARSFYDLANATMESAGVEPRIEFIDMPEQLRGRYQYFTEASMTKLRESGFPYNFSSLETGISDYVKRFLLKDKFR